MHWKFHSLTVEGHSNAAALMNTWATSFASRPIVLDSAESDIHITLDLVPAVPAKPRGTPDFTQGDLLSYYVNGDTVIAHFPRFGQLYLDLANGSTKGQLVEAVLTTYGALEDMIAIGLTAHLRRKGYFLIHAFAAAFQGKAALLVGGIGAGKTTTGLSLLDAGWQLLSNDSPIIAAAGQVLSYPGVLAGYPETFARFASTAHLAGQKVTQSGRQKLLISAEAIFPNVWLDAAPIGAIIFPQIEDRTAHALTPLSEADALRLLLPHAVEQWDKPMIPRHFSILRQLATSAPAYTLHLSPDVLAIPPIVQQAVSNSIANKQR